MTLKLGQEEVDSVLYRSIEKSPRLDTGLFKYDPVNATYKPLPQRAGGQPAGNNCTANKKEEDRNNNFARS